MNWTKRYCDYEHLRGIKKGFQVKVCHWTDWSEGMVLEGLRDVGKAVFEGPDHEQLARSWGEQQAKGLGLVMP